MSDHSILTVTKRSAARAEIEGAIRAIAEHKNFIAADLLASAAIDVIYAISRAADIKTFYGEFNDRINPEFRKEAWRILNSNYNFLKHADRDGNTAIDRYRTDSAVWKTFIATLDYEAVWKSKSLEMGIYLSWFFSRFPHLLLEEHTDVTSTFNSMFGELEGKPEHEALRILHRVFRE